MHVFISEIITDCSFVGKHLHTEHLLYKPDGKVCTTVEHIFIPERSGYGWQTGNVHIHSMEGKEVGILEREDLSLGKGDRICSISIGESNIMQMEVLYADDCKRRLVACQLQY